MNTPINWELPPEEILVLLQESSMVKTGRKVRFNDLEDQFPNSGYRSTVANSVAKFARVDAEAQIVMIAASGEGADLSHASSQEKIQQIATEDNWPMELTQWILSRCAQLKYRWQSEGFDAEPTLEVVQFEQSRRGAIKSTATRINAASEARRSAIDDPTKTGEEIIAATVEAFG